MFRVLQKANLACAAFGTLVLCAGCGSQETPTNQSVSSQATKVAAVKKVMKTPDATVKVFLQSLKLGNQQRATELLTSLAQQEMQRHEAMIQPPGSTTATFEVTQVEYVGEQQEAAHVFSLWRDTDPEGDLTEHEIVWILRQQGEEWAIAGFATRVFDDRPPIILNFEDPMDLHRKRNAVDAEIARRNRTESQTR